MNIKFISESLEDYKHTMVMISIECFGKMVWMVPLRESDAWTLADKFLNMVVIQYGLPHYNISEYDPRFCGKFWDELISLGYYTYL